MFKVFGSLARPLVVLSLALFMLFAWTGTTLAQGPSGGSSAVPKPPPPAGAQSIGDTPEMDKLAAGTAKTLGFSNYVYEVWQLPPTSTWDDTFKYYSDQMVQLKWSGSPVVQQDIPGGKVGAWLNADGKTGLVIVYVASTDGKQPAYDFAIFGVTTPAPSPKTDWQSIPKTAAMDQSVAGIAQSASFSNYVYEMWQAPAALTWDDLFKYFTDQMAQGGWKGPAPIVTDQPDFKMGLWLDSTNNTGLVVFFGPSSDGKSPSIIAAIVGMPATK